MAQLAPSKAGKVGPFTLIEATSSSLNVLNLGRACSGGLNVGDETSLLVSQAHSSTVQFISGLPLRGGLGPMENPSICLVSGASSVFTQGLKRCKELGGMSLSLEPKHGKEKLHVGVAAMETSLADTFHIGVAGGSVMVLRLNVLIGANGRPGSKLHDLKAVNTPP
ncbi:hypothetical protein CJ030_MR5G011876 [Morella rubra]|uniref:Uncharacterized protein n=1 Tax=Morella rubra TaxID=262757 RepID=A0A6A1VLN1_9ROSI|nr:hypothetical protein CJ030_MR5G011876 [Morella rubra]